MPLIDLLKLKNASPERFEKLILSLAKQCSASIGIEGYQVTVDKMKQELELAFKNLTADSDLALAV